MTSSVSVGWGVRIRVFILFVLGALLFVPGAVMVMVGIFDMDLNSDDTVAMLIMGGALSFCGLFIWVTMRKIYRRGKQRAAYIRSQAEEGLLMGTGMIHMHNMAAMHDVDETADDSDSNTDIDSGDDFDDGGGDFDIGD
jgi:hypothetical protein